MRDKYYSPNAAWEVLLKASCNMRSRLIRNARLKFFNDLEKRINEIVRINKLTYKELIIECEKTFINPLP